MSFSKSAPQPTDAIGKRYQKPDVDNLPAVELKTSSNDHKTSAPTPTLDALNAEYEKLCEFRDSTKNKCELLKAYNDTMKTKVQTVAEIFAKSEDAALKENKELYWELKGKVYAESPYFKEEAISSLAIAVKLNPSSVKAWNLLGECYCVSDNIDMAIKCFNNALQVTRDAKLLLNLSIALRRHPKRTRQDIQESFTLAQEAVALNSHDFAAWMIMGNALVTCFFNYLHVDDNPLMKALKAYDLANHLAPGDFEVCCNLSSTQRYIGRYEDALNTLKSCSTTVLIDQVKAAEEYNVLKTWLVNLTQLVEKRGKLRSSRLANFVKVAGDCSKKLASQVESSKPGESRVPGDSSDLKNEKKTECGVVIFSIPSAGPLPLAIGLLGADSSIQVATIFNIAIGKSFKVGATINYSSDLTASPVNFKVDDEVVNFNNIQIFDPAHLILNGKKISPSYLSRSCVRLE